MLFSSLEFVLGFLPLALGVTVLARRWLGLQAAMLVLLVCSLVFYGWTYPVYLLLIAGSIFGNFLLGKWIARYHSHKLAIAGITGNLALLGWFKYAGLFSQTFSLLAGGDFTIAGVVLPLAISFFTFQQIAYLADCYAGDGADYHFVDYALFVMFFPQLIAGPIVHHRDLAPQWRSARFCRLDRADLAGGLLLFSIGLSKKVLLADSLAPLADRAFDQAASGLAVAGFDAWLGVLAYSFQIYFDFSGYSDMALGLGLLFGIVLPLNFDSPYKSRSIAQFWRSWHITLSTFLRDYLYIPLGGNRQGEMRRLANLFAVMLLGGLWHGAGWTFMAWGGLHGAYLALHRIWQRTLGRSVTLGTALSTLLTFAFVTLAWVFFRSADFHSAARILEGLAGGAGPTPPAGSLTLSGLLALLLAPLIAFAAPNAFEIYRRQQDNTGRTMTLPMALQGAASAFALLMLFSWGTYEFIYFQF